MNPQGLISRFTRGTIAGVVGTGPMTGVMELYRRGVPDMRKDPFIPRQVAEGIARRVGFEAHVDELGEPGWWGLTATSHFGFGGLAGAVYGIIEPLFNRTRSSGTRRPRKAATPKISRNLAQGAGFGLVVWATHYLGLFPALGLIKPHGDKPIQKNTGLVLSHLVWGMSTSLLYDSLLRRSQRSIVPFPAKKRSKRRV